MAPYKQPVNWLLQKIRRQGEMCLREQYFLGMTIVSYYLQGRFETLLNPHEIELIFFFSIDNVR